MEPAIVRQFHLIDESDHESIVWQAIRSISVSHTAVGWQVITAPLPVVGDGVFTKQLGHYSCCDASSS